MILRKLLKFRERRPPEETPGPEGKSRALTMAETIDEEGLVKPFLDHLEDLRLMFIKIVATLVVTMIGAFFFRVQLVELLQSPLVQVDPELAANLISLRVPDAMTISFKIAFYTGLVVSFPLILYYIAQFVFPGLTKREKRYVLPALCVGGGLFLGGVLFCFYMVMPAALEFFYQDAKRLNWTPNWTVSDYFSFVTQLCIAFGLSFELPVVILVLVKLELLSFDLMRKTRSYAVVAIIFVSAVITPTTDILTLAALAGPLLILYEACIWLAFLMERKRRAADTAS